MTFESELGTEDEEGQGFESFREEFDPWEIVPENIWDVMNFVLNECPVPHGRDSRGDFYMVGKHSDVMNVLQNWRTFNSNMFARIGSPALPVEMPPFDSNPPLQQHLRRILNPYLAPQKVTDYELGAREIVRGLISEFPSTGPFDIAAYLFQPLPPILTFRLLLGLEDRELGNARRMIEEVLYGRHNHDVSDSQEALMQWLHELVRRRRSDISRRDDIVDGLVHGTVEGGRSLTDDELVGSILVLLLGGFVTTTEATSSLLVRLAEDRTLQEMLRSDPGLLPLAIEEHLRLMPPVGMLTRECMAHVELRGRSIEPGSRVGWLISAANRDPEEFDRPDEFDMNRNRNRHLTFGGGVHRCVGSNFARMSIRVTFEELLSHFEDFGIAPDDKVDWISRSPGSWCVAQRIPVALVPAKG